MKNSVLDRAWTKLREQILTHLHACHAAGRPIPTVTLDIERVSHTTGRALARLSDGTIIAEQFSLTDVCVEHLQATQPQIDLTPSIAASIGELRACHDFTDVQVITANPEQAHVLVTPRSTEAVSFGDWSRPTEPFLMTIPARTGATVQ